MKWSDVIQNHRRGLRYFDTQQAAREYHDLIKRIGKGQPWIGRTRNTEGQIIYVVGK